MREATKVFRGGCDGDVTAGKCTGRESEER